MPSTFRINAIIAYVDGSVSNYTSANDRFLHQLSATSFTQVENELFSWPSFLTFMESTGSLNVGIPVDVSHIRDIAWSVAMDDGTGKNVIGGFKATGGSGVNSNTTYDSTTFSNVDSAIGGQLTMSAVVTATMRPDSIISRVARGSGYTTASGELTVVGGTSSDPAVLNITSFSTIAGQTEADYTATETSGTFAPGGGYAMGDTITLDDGTVITVDAEAAGAVTAFTVTSASTIGHTNFIVLLQNVTSGIGGGFTLTQDQDSQGIFAAALKVVGVPVGDYTVLPTSNSNPVSVTPTVGSGSGATFRLDWGVRNVTVADGGEGYTAVPAVAFSGAGSGTEAVAVAVLTNGVVTSVTVSSAGDGYTSAAEVAIDAPL